MKRKLLIAVAGLGALYLAVLGTYLNGFKPPWRMRGERRA